MRIALSGWFEDRPETGSGQYLRRLLSSLARLHPDVTWVLLAPPEHVRGQLALPGVHFLPLPAPPGPLGKVWWEQVTLPHAARRLGVELLHVPYWAPPLAARLPTVVTVHDLIPLLLQDYRGGPAVRLYTALVRSATPRVTLLLTDSEASRADIARHLRVAPGRVRVIPLAADVVYRPAAGIEDGAILRKLGLQPGYILYLGGFDRRKNLRAVFQTFARVREALGEAARLVVAGKLPVEDSDFAPDPRRLRREAGLPETAVHFTGFVSEEAKPALYRSARTFLYPSRYEGFGLPPLEALACGVPVVGSDATSLPEVVGDAGVLTAPDDIAGMAGALLQLLTDEAFHVDLRCRALRQAARFSWEATAEATFAAYREVIAGRSS